MFINNGDGTYTVRFYGGTYGAYGNANGTVSDGFARQRRHGRLRDRQFVAAHLSNGMLAYADYGFNAANPTRLALDPAGRKGLRQWNETGNEGRDGTNTYNSIQGGWMATVDAQVLGHNATDYSLTDSTEQAMINALAANRGGDHRHRRLAAIPATPCPMDCTARTPTR